MEREKKKALALAILIGFAIIVAIFIFLWGAYLNRGTIRIIADAPFNVITLEGETLCDTSPCEIVRKTGVHGLILTKTGYQNISTEIKVKLWSTVDLELKFIANPYIESTDKFPEPEKEISYKIIFDDSNKTYKLVKADDNQERAIVYFQKEIKSPLIFGSENGALIIDTEEEAVAYKIDIKNAERERVDEDLRNAEEGAWSNDGEKFAFTTSDSDYLYVLDQNNAVSQLSLEKENTVYAWTYNGDLFYATLEDSYYVFGEYDPEIKSYTQRFSSSELSGLPDIIIPANNGKKIYFQIGDGEYMLILEKL